MIPDEIGVIPRKRGKVGHGEALGQQALRNFLK